MFENFLGDQSSDFGDNVCSLATFRYGVPVRHQPYTLMVGLCRTRKISLLCSIRYHADRLSAPTKTDLCAYVTNTIAFCKR